MILSAVIRYEAQTLTETLKPPKTPAILTASDTRAPAARGVVRRVAFDYLRPFLGLAMIGIAANALAASTTGVLPWLIQQALDRIFVEQDSQMLIWIPVAAVVVMSAGAIFEYVAGLTLSSVGQRVVAAVQSQLFARLVQADLAWLQSTHSGRFISSFMTDAVRLRDTMTATIFNLTQNLLKVIALIAAMFYLNPQFALIGIIVLPVAALFLRKLGRRTRKATTHGLEGTGDLSALISESLTGIRVVKAYGQESRAIERAVDTITTVLAHNMRAIRARVSAAPMTGIVTSFGVAGVLYFGGLQVQSGSLTVGELIGFLSAMLFAYQPLKAVANQQTVMQEGVAAASRIFALLDIEPLVVDRPGAAPLHITDGSIVFDHVTFDYGDGTPALRGVSIEVPKGHTVALVGPSGAGKSTILNLVPRFYDVTGGRVAVDGQDVRDVAIASLRGASSLVTQEPFLFDDTIRANIAYGRPEAGDGEIEQAARQAAAHDFILELPHGYDTRVGEAGVKLSGGQRQRIAIARAMLKNAPILLLDEATSSLDTASEMQVQAALGTLMRGRTTLVIAHRLSTIMHADDIYVIDDGRVRERGTHDALIAQGGLYAELYRSQFAREEPAPAVAGE